MNRPAARLATLLLPALLAAPAACSRGERGAPAPAVRRYAVRGEVVRLPERPGGELLVRHEAVPGFVDRTGAAVGMAAMVMPFAVGREVALGDLAPGDRVLLRFAVDWGKVAFWVEGVERLPPGTPLDFGPRSGPGR